MPEINESDLFQGLATQTRADEGMMSGFEEGMNKTNVISLGILDMMKASALKAAQKGDWGPAENYNEVAQTYNEIGPDIAAWNLHSNMADMLDPKGGQQLVGEMANPHHHACIMHLNAHERAIVFE